MAAPPRVCLACGQATQPSNRRLLSSEASTTVRQVWSELLAERIVSLVLYGGHSAKQVRFKIRSVA